MKDSIFFIFWNPQRDFHLQSVVSIYINRFSDRQLNDFLATQQDAYDHFDENIIMWLYDTFRQRENFRKTRKSVLAFPQILPFSMTRIRLVKKAFFLSVKKLLPRVRRIFIYIYFFFSDALLIILCRVENPPMGRARDAVSTTDFMKSA